MKTPPFYTIAIFSLLIFSCVQDKPQSPQKSVSKTEDATTDSIPIFWATICKNSDFSYFFNCNKENCYQIELFNDPFKDLVVITLNLNDSLTDIIHLNRFSFRASKNFTKDKKNTLKKVYPIINPITKDTIFCGHQNTKTMKVAKQQDLNYFFSTTIWQIPTKDKNLDLDGESWKVKGRNGDKEVAIVRWNFSDSLYYSKIQNLLDLCKVSDYQYKKR